MNDRWMRNQQARDQQHRLMREAISGCKSGDFSLIARLNQYVTEHQVMALYENFGVPPDELGQWNRSALSASAEVT